MRACPRRCRTTCCSRWPSIHIVLFPFGVSTSGLSAGRSSIDDLLSIIRRTFSGTLTSCPRISGHTSDGCRSSSGGGDDHLLWLLVVTRRSSFSTLTSCPPMAGLTSGGCLLRSLRFWRRRIPFPFLGNSFAVIHFPNHFRSVSLLVI